MTDERPLPKKIGTLVGTKQGVDFHPVHLKR